MCVCATATLSTHTVMPARLPEPFSRTIQRSRAEQVRFDVTYSEEKTGASFLFLSLCATILVNRRCLIIAIASPMRRFGEILNRFLIFGLYSLLVFLILRRPGPEPKIRGGGHRQNTKKKKCGETLRVFLFGSRSRGIVVAAPAIPKQASKH